MLTETDSIKTYQEHLTILPILDLGIGRIRKLLCWPEEHEPSALAPYMPCLFEYIAFSEGVVIPFFQVLHTNLKKHIYSLYVYLRDNGKEPESFLTHDEAFDFLCALGHSDTRNIIDHYNRFPSNAYTGVINSIHTQDKTAFIAALKGTDCQDLMGVLWTMRYLLFGIQSEKDVRIIKRGKRIQLENLWLTDTWLAPFFRNIPKEEEERFAEERIKLLCGFDTKSFVRRHRIGRQQYNCDTIAETRPYTHYTDSKRKPWKQFLLESEKKGTTSTSLLSSITYNCKIQTYKILLSALRSHKDAISQRIGNVGGKSFSVAIEQKWKDEEWDYVELECQDFLDFITLSLQQMKSVTTKIKWRGKNVLLGHIIRCLLSDKKNAPENMGIASEFFESKSGNTINLASAKQVPVNDYEKERNNLDPNFVEAVELLRRCGFINVELTSKRR